MIKHYVPSILSIFLGVLIFWAPTLAVAIVSGTLICSGVFYAIHVHKILNRDRRTNFRAASEEPDFKAHLARVIVAFRSLGGRSDQR